MALAARTAPTGHRDVGVLAGRPALLRLLPKRERTRQQLLFFAFLLPAFAYVALFFGYPLYQDITISFQNYGFAALAAGHGPYVGFANYSSMLGSSTTVRAILNTVVFTVASVAFQFAIGFAMAVFLNRQFFLSNVLRRLILIPWVMPLVITGTVFYLIFQTSNGLANELLQGAGLIHAPIGWLTSGNLAVLAMILANIWAGVPFNAVLPTPACRTFPGNSWRRRRWTGPAPGSGSPM